MLNRSFLFFVGFRRLKSCGRLFEACSAISERLWHRHTLLLCLCVHVLFISLISINLIVLHLVLLITVKETPHWHINLVSKSVDIVHPLRISCFYIQPHRFILWSGDCLEAAVQTHDQLLCWCDVDLCRALVTNGALLWLELWLVSFISHLSTCLPSRGGIIYTF